MASSLPITVRYFTILQSKKDIPDTMRTVKFAPDLVPLLFPDKSGKPPKTATWRLGEDYVRRPFRLGEQIVLCGNGGLEEPVAIARVEETFRKPFDELTPEDCEGHEAYPDDETMYSTFQRYYPDEAVGLTTPVTVAKMKTLGYVAVCNERALVLIEANDD
jgi:hypothetical protein